MGGNERREKIIDIIKKSSEPVSGTDLAKTLGVSRQIIVQDIALIRASDKNIIATNKGYIVTGNSGLTKVFKVRHKPEESQVELNAIVDMGGRVIDVFVYHKAYDVVRVPMNIGNRRDVLAYMKSLEGGVSVPLMSLTADYHYHTIEADSPEVFDDIEAKLKELGYIAKLKEFEPEELMK